MDLMKVIEFLHNNGITSLTIEKLDSGRALITVTESHGRHTTIRFSPEAHIVKS